MGSDRVIYDKSFNFAVRIVRLYRFLTKEHKEYSLAKQLLRAGTSIGANVNEAKYAQSRNDFISKMNIALKKAAETEYWIRLLIESGCLTEKQGESIRRDCDELIKILHAIVKTTRNTP